MGRFLIPLLVGSLACAAEPTVEPLAVVQSWQDLLSQPVITVASGVHARFGIESRSRDAGGGITVYCLSDDFQAPTDGSDDACLGPVLVRVSRSGKAVPPHPAAVRWKRCQQSAAPGSLYAGLIPLPECGTYQVSLVDRSGLVREHASVVAANQTPPWSDLGAAVDRHKPLADVGIHTLYASIAFGTSQDVPQCDGLLPQAYLPAEHRQRLPVMLPQEPDPSTTLAMDAAGRLLLTLPHPMEIGCADGVLLARWWRHGAALTLEATTPALVQLGAAGRLVTQVALELDPSMRLVPGEHLGLQLLVCPEGWQGMTGDELPQRWSILETRYAPTLSNRYDFVVH